MLFFAEDADLGRSGRLSYDIVAAGGDGANFSVNERIIRSLVEVKAIPASTLGVSAESANDPFCWTKYLVLLYLSRSCLQTSCFAYASVIARAPNNPKGFGEAGFTTLEC